MASWRPTSVKTILAKFASKCYWCGRPIRKGAIVDWYMDEKMVVHHKCHLDAYVA